MSTLNKPHGSPIKGLWGGLGVVGLLGLIYCLLALGGLQPSPLQAHTLILYGVYCAVIVASAIGILRWKRWGLYALGSATFSLGVIGLFQNSLSPQDALIGLGVAALAVILLRPGWRYFD